MRRSVVGELTRDTSLEGIANLSTLGNPGSLHGGSKLIRSAPLARGTRWLYGSTGSRVAVGYSAGVTGQEFSNKINDELTLFGCSSVL
jgi:hypothetical protein